MNAPAANNLTRPVASINRQAPLRLRVSLVAPRASLSSTRCFVCVNSAQTRGCHGNSQHLRRVQSGFIITSLPQRQARSYQCLRAATGRQSDSTELVAITQPVSKYDVDKDLWEVLDLCDNDELELLYNTLHASSPFSPVVKSLVGEKEPALIELRGRSSIMHKIESRFRFLAADAVTLLRGRRPAYREALLAIRDRLDVQCPSTLSTPDLEAEVFIHVLQNCSEYVSAVGDPDPAEAADTAHAFNEGDGMATMQPRSSSTSGNWTERLTAPLRFGAPDLFPALVKLGGAATVTAVGTRAAERLGGQLIMRHLGYQAALQAVTTTARVSGVAWQKQAALHAAQKSLTAAAARYGAVRSALSFLGPIMWGSLAVDLAMASVGTDYARIIRTVFIMAQIRLVRTGGFVSPEQATPPATGDSAA